MRSPWIIQVDPKPDTCVKGQKRRKTQREGCVEKRRQRLVFAFTGQGMHLEPAEEQKRQRRGFALKSPKESDPVKALFQTSGLQTCGEYISAAVSHSDYGT